jgi:DNA modification methylase
MSNQKELFGSKYVRGKPGSGKLFEEELVVNAGPVTCLGIEFENDDARREYFTEKLKRKLLEPEFRKIEGFPLGEDEDILKLSDPPYYTVCPNPWIADFVEEWEGQKPKKPEGYNYHREPFAADVSEGKYDPIYKMHPYHTKVPHKAIMRYILHYTEPGDIIFDGFSGTGMAGVAAQMCGNREEVMSLGYQVKPDGTIMSEDLNEKGEKIWKEISKIGTRKSLLSDLSPVASFIGKNYNIPNSVLLFEKEANKILEDVREETSWMFETEHSDGQKGKIKNVIWSDVFSCPECNEEIIFWNTAVDIVGGKIYPSFPCPECSSILTKRKLERIFISIFDQSLNEPKQFGKQIPVLINYSVGKQRFTKDPDSNDLKKISDIESMILEKWYPANKLPVGVNTSQPKRSHGFDHVHHFYTKRNLAVLSSFRDRATSSELSALTAVALRITKRYGLTYQSGVWGAGGGPTNGTYYIPSLIKELNMTNMLEAAIKKQTKGKKKLLFNKGDSLIGVQSLDNISCNNNVIDYVFIDPPFGSNLNYSELNFLWESWLKVWTNNKPEAIENKFQSKGQLEYRNLMTDCFKEAYRVLKPGRWMTVEFSNTKASIWNSIQTALTDAGFIVASVSALDKKKGSFKALTTPTAVKQDLIISAYKPNGGFEERFERLSKTEEGVWDFVRTHLSFLPVIKKQGAELVVIPERDPRILYDQIIAYYVRKGFSIPIDSKEFQLGLSQRFSERDGMYFLPEQVAEYDRNRMISGGRAIQQSLFVFDEASAIEWLRNLLRDKPQRFQDINPLFMNEISGWSKNEVGLELSVLLEQNFLSYDRDGMVPEQIHSYLSSNWKEMRKLSKDDLMLQEKAKNRWYVPDPNKAGDLEKLREKALLKEFEEYIESKKKLKVFRLEAVRVGFKKAWQDRDYEVIISVAEKIPNKVLEEDPKLLMWFDQAVTRSGVN